MVSPPSNHHFTTHTTQRKERTVVAAAATRTRTLAQWVNRDDPLSAEASYREATRLNPEHALACVHTRDTHTRPTHRLGARRLRPRTVVGESVRTHDPPTASAHERHSFIYITYIMCVDCVVHRPSSNGER